MAVAPPPGIVDSESHDDDNWFKKLL
jgi:hypothetical protein